MITTLRHPLERFTAPPANGRLWVFYDGVCGACSQATAWALAMDRHRRLRAVPLQSADAQGQLGALADGPALAELHVWSAERGIERGVDALAAILRELPGGEPWARRLTSPRVRPWAERAYRWFAERRMLFGAASCDVRR